LSAQGKPVRLKTYTAETGLVYQYYFVGKRKALAEAATEFVFDVTSDRRVRFSVSVFVPDASLAAWKSAHGRALVDAEIYAAAKMRLTRAFDEMEDLFDRGRRLIVDVAALEALLSTLGIE
jgi:hypothetical protein